MVKTRKKAFFTIKNGEVRRKKSKILLLKTKKSWNNGEKMVMFYCYKW